MEVGDEREIVIVGGGICGLATALAFHRKGIRTLVLERSDSQRASGLGIIIQQNGWCALDQLGVASKLRPTAMMVPRRKMISLAENSYGDSPHGYGEARCLKRSTLIEALASDLPPNTVRLSCQVNAIKLDPLTSDPVVYLEDGTLIKAKVVIGCDGLNSVVASFLELKFNYNYSTSLVRGLTYYEKGHGMDDFVILYKDPTRLGRIPIDENLVYWFVVQNRNPQDPLYMKDQKLMQQSALESIKDFPREAVEIIEKADLDSFHYACLGYRVPWDLLFKRHYKGGVTVAGDAMHAMAPFMGQGGAASIEDAVVLARCAAPTIQMLRANQKEGKKMLELAFHQYEKERKMRVTLLCLQTYLIGLLIKTSSSLGKFVTILLMIILFRDPDKLSLYDCGRL